jgi:hypothetical protein
MAALKGNLGDGAKLDKLLTELPARLRKRLLTKALKAGVQPVLDEAQRLAPYEHGDYIQSLHVRAGKPDARETTVGVAGGNGLAYLLEFGHKAANQHGTYGHVPGHPHLRRAMEAKEKAAIEAIREVLSKRFAEALK